MPIWSPRATEVPILAAAATFLKSYGAEASVSDDRSDCNQGFIGG